MCILLQKDIMQVSDGRQRVSYYPSKMKATQLFTNTPHMPKTFSSIFPALGWHICIHCYHVFTTYRRTKHILEYTIVFIL